MLLNNVFFFSHMLILKAELCAGNALLSDARGVLWRPTLLKTMLLVHSTACPLQEPCQKGRLCTWLRGSWLTPHITFWASPIVFITLWSEHLNGNSNRVSNSRHLGQASTKEIFNKSLLDKRLKSRILILCDCISFSLNATCLISTVHRWLAFCEC